MYQPKLLQNNCHTDYLLPLLKGLPGQPERRDQLWILGRWLDCGIVLLYSISVKSCNCLGKQLRIIFFFFRCLQPCVEKVRDDFNPQIKSLFPVTMSDDKHLHFVAH